MPNNQQITVTLPVEYWKVIMDFIKYSCQIKGDDWIKWGQEINQTIQSSIEKNAGENPIKGINRTTISSSNLNSVGYDVKTRTLEIQFNEGSIYQHYQVPQEIYVSLMRAESHGQYYSAVIRGAFQSSKIGYEPLQGYSNDDENDYGDANEERWTEYDIKGMLDMGDNFATYWEDAGRDD